MKVYLVMQEVPYEGERVLHVCADKEKADKLAADLQRGETFYNYGVDEWEVE